MESAAARYDRLAARFAEKVAAVPGDRWESPAPCEGWTARDVVRHVVETPGMFFGMVGREMGPVPRVEQDPAAAFAESRSQVQAALDDPAQAGAEFDGFFGRSTFAQGIERFVCVDLLVHGWDLARAAGLDETIPDDDLAWVEAGVEGLGDAMRTSGAFGPALEPPEGADRQTRLLAFLGRRA
jgi:uncharacterized protein (TIGR03086 family)